MKTVRMLGMAAGAGLAVALALAGCGKGTAAGGGVRLVDVMNAPERYQGKTVKMSVLVNWEALSSIPEVLKPEPEPQGGGLDNSMMDDMVLDRTLADIEAEKDKPEEVIPEPVESEPEEPRVVVNYMKLRDPVNPGVSVNAFYRGEVPEDWQRTPIPVRAEVTLHVLPDSLQSVFTGIGEITAIKLK